MSSTTTAPTVAIGQIESVRDPEVNLTKASLAVKLAAERGAAIIVFPEYLMSWGDGLHDRKEMASVAQSLDGPFVTGLSRLASDHDIWIIGGVIEEPAGTSARPHNTTVVLDKDGCRRAAYRKSHLFDAFFHKESATFSPGQELLEPLETPIGHTGLFVCYELRFPEVARRAADLGAEVLVVPSAWVAGPMKDLHWRTLIQARAIENGCYVIAAAQVGNEFSGQSMVVDPQGVIVAGAGEAEATIFAGIDLARVTETRGTVPSLQQRRRELY